MSATSFPVIAEGKIGEAVVQTVNARDLHAALGIGKQFGNWIVDRIGQYAFSENSDFVVFTETGKNPSGGRPAKEYALTLDMAKELAMVERNEKGKEVRRYFIECERKLQTRQAVDVASLTAEVRKVVGGIVKSVVHSEITTAINGLSLSPDAIRAAVQSEMARQQFILRRGKTAGEVYRDNRFPPIKNVSKWLSNKLIKAGCRVDGNGCAELGVSKARLFDPDKAQQWLDELGGRQLVELKIAERLGQKAFKLVPMPTPTPKGLMAVLAAMVISGLALMGLPEPAKALPVREGITVMRVDGHSVMVDTNKFRVGPDNLVVRLHRDGHFSVGPVRYDDMPKGLGVRGAMEPWQLPGPNVLTGTLRQSDAVQIIGAVIN